MKMKIDSEAVELTELKDVKFDLVDSKEAYKYDDGVKKIGAYVGRMYGKAMKVLVVSLTEDDIKKPKYPTGNNASEEAKAIWSKEYDQYLKKKEKYDDQKAKTHEVVHGCCAKQMKNRLEQLGAHDDCRATLCG